MAGFLRAVALDLDGTLTEHHELSEPALAAVDDVRADELAAVLVTGRILGELEQDHPGLARRFDAVVAENGAVLALEDEVRDLAAPVEESLAAALSGRDVPFRRGRVLLAGDARHAPVVVEAVGLLGLDCQVIRNRDALMVLPAGVSKATGLLAALIELGISPHNTLAVGDAENDLALLEAAEVGVAVANAVPSLRAHADLVLEGTDGAGVAALLSGPIRTGERPVRPARRRVTIGRFADGTPATVPGAQANVLLCGETGAGKSHLAGLLVERWIAAGDVVLVVDMEGEHVALHRLRTAIVLDDQPSPRELTALLGQRSLSVVLDLSGSKPQEKLDYLAALPEVVEAQRAAWALPHWIVVDEAHATLREGGVGAHVFRTTDRGYCLVTYRPEQLAAEALATIDVTITLTTPAVPGPRETASSATATLREAGATEREFLVSPRRTPHVRHRHKYAATPLPAHRRFHFRQPDGTVIATAEDLAEFGRLLGSVDASVLAHHLEHGDLSRWITGTIQAVSSARSPERSNATCWPIGPPTSCAPGGVCSTSSSRATWRSDPRRADCGGQSRERARRPWAALPREGTALRLPPPHRAEHRQDAEQAGRREEVARSADGTAADAHRSAAAPWAVNEANAARISVADALTYQAGHY